MVQSIGSQTQNAYYNSGMNPHEEQGSSVQQYVQHLQRADPSLQNSIAEMSQQYSAASLQEIVKPLLELVQRLSIALRQSNVLPAGQIGAGKQQTIGSKEELHLHASSAPISSLQAKEVRQSHASNASDATDQSSEKAAATSKTSKSKLSDSLTGALLDVAVDAIPEGYAAITTGSDASSVLAVPASDYASFQNFLSGVAGAGAGYLGGQAGSALGGAVGEAIGASPAQIAALEAAAGTVSSAAAGAAASAAVGGATSGAAAAAAASAAVWALPVVAVYAAWTKYSNFESMQDAVGGGPLTDEELKMAGDVFGLEQFAEKITPDELEDIIPKEIDYVLRPHTFIEKQIWGSSKPKDQILRDRIRNHLEKLGMASKIDGSHHLTLADGSTYNIGLDGGHKLYNLDGTQRPAYGYDPSHPFSSQAIGWANPVIHLLTGGDDKLASDFTGYIVNAAESNAHSLDDVRDNMLAIFDSLGLSATQITAGLHQLRKDEKITPEEYQAFVNGIVSLIDNQIVRPADPMEFTASEIEAKWHENPQKSE